MAWARVAAVNEHYTPLQRMDVECFDLDTQKPIDVVRTDSGGVALFTGLPNDQRFFFRARAIRVSTKVGGRTYTGVIRIQILASSAYCFTALVDPTGQWGSHKTIQAAMDDASATGINHIGIYPGNYDEALAVTDSKHYWLESCGRPYTGEFSTLIPPISGGTIAVLIRADVPGNDPALDYDGSGSFVAQGIHFRADTTTGAVTTEEIGTLRLVNCQITQNGTGGGLVGDLSSGSPRGVELRHVRVLLDDDSQLAVNLLYSPYLIEKCEFLGGVLLGRTGSLVRGIIRDCHIQGAASPLVALASLQDGYITVSGCHLNLKAAVDGIVVTDTGGGSSAIRCIISGNTFEGYNVAGNTAVDVSSIACTGGALVNSNYFERFAVGVALGTNGLAWGNYYTNVTADVTGTNNVSPTEVSASTAFNHAFLDGTIHTDTVAQAVTAGSLIFGNDTPAWDELAISVPAANVLNVLGVANGETVPSWKTVLDGTAPTTIAESAAAAPGTSLIFAHRDHTHGAPATWAATAHALGGAVHTGVADYTSVLGLASLTIADANFGLALSGSDPRLTVDSGDYLGYIRAGNYFSFVPGAVESLQVGATFLRAVGYLRVGSLSAPANTTAGDFSASRLKIGLDAAMANNSIVDSETTWAYTSGGSWVYRVALHAQLTGAGGSHTALRPIVHCEPTAASTQYVYGANCEVDHLSGNYNLGYLHGGNFAVVQSLDGNTITQAVGGRFAVMCRAGTITTAICGEFIKGDISTGTPVVTTSIGLKVGAAIVPVPGTDIGILVDAQLTAALWFNTDTAASGVIAWGTARDTNLYRSAASVLKTDDSFVAGGTVSVGTDAVLTRFAANRLTLGIYEWGNWNGTAWCYVGHSNLDHTIVGNYALIQSSAGTTYINAATGQELGLRINNASVVRITAAAIGFYGTAPIAQQTGVAVSAAGVHAALVALGLITA